MSADPRPALLGGPAEFPAGPPDWPPVDAAVRAALDAALADGSWGKYDGGHVADLESRLAKYHGVPHALTCGSGTFAVELALRALKIGPGDEVILSAYDYPGNFLSVHAVGAMPVLVDVEPGNCQLDVTRIEPALSPTTRAVIVSHLHGGILRMRELMDLAARRGLRVVEDAAQCPGAIVQGRKAGTWADVGILSFGGSKLLTAGRGGAILTRHADVLQRARLALIRGNVVCPLSELQAAVLGPQLTTLDERNEYRRGQASVLAGLPGLSLFGPIPDDCAPGYYKVGFLYDANAFDLPRERFLAALRAEGVAFDEGFRVLHAGRSPSRYRAGDSLSEATRVAVRITVLHHPVLLQTPEMMTRVVAAVRKVWAHRRALQ